MHTFANLRPNPSPPWADQCAAKIPILTVVRGGWKALLGVLREGALCPDAAFAKVSTLQAEHTAGIARANYFFAGRAYPAPVGPATFFMPSGREAGLSGKASPFDTGGVTLGWSLLPWNTFAPTQAKYISDHSEDITFFREYYSKHLAAFFDSAAQYWEGAPSRRIDTRDLSNEKKWRDWTFEVRIPERVSIEHIDLYITPSMNTLLLEEERHGAITMKKRPTVSDVPTDEAEERAFKVSTS